MGKLVEVAEMFMNCCVVQERGTGARQYPQLVPSAVVVMPHCSCGLSFFLQLPSRTQPTFYVGGGASDMCLHDGHFLCHVKPGVTQGGVYEVPAAAVC